MKKLILVWMMMAIPAWAAEPPPKSQIGAYVELQGAPKKVQGVLDQLTKEEAYKTADCETLPASKNSKIAGISCAKPDNGLMQLLTLSAGTGVSMKLSAQDCIAGCVPMACPPPGGPVGCCTRGTRGFRRC